MIPIDEVIIFDVCTHAPSTAAVSDADSAPVFDVFEEDTDTPILAAQTMTKRTSKTGNYRGSITCSAANGFEAGKWYSVVVSATVSTITGKCVAKHFRVAPVELVAGVPKVDVADWLGTAPSTPTVAGVPNVNAKTWNDLATVALPLVPATAGRSLVVDAAGLADANVVKLGPTGSGTAQTARDVGATLGVAGAGLTALGDTRIANLDATISSRTKPADTQARVTLVDTATTLTNAPLDSSGITTLLTRLSALRAGYLDNLSAGAVALEASLQALITTVGAAGAGLTAAATAVWNVATRVLTAGTNIVLAKGVGVTGFSDLDAAGVRGAVGLAAANLDTQLDALPTNAELAASQAAADDATLAAIAALTIPTAAQNRAEMDSNSTKLASIDAKTTNLPSDPADESLVIAATDAVMARLGAPVGASLSADVAAKPTALQNADALLDRADAIETGLTLRQAHRLEAAAAAGKLSGAATTTVVIRNAVQDSKARVTATVDSDGNRTAIVADVT